MGFLNGCGGGEPHPLSRNEACVRCPPPEPGFVAVHRRGRTSEWFGKGPYGQWFEFGRVSTQTESCQIWQGSYSISMYFARGLLQNRPSCPDPAK